MSSGAAERPLALVTGASSGIGAEFARRLGRDGYHVIGVARRADRLEALAQELAGSGGGVRPLIADLSARGGIDAVAAVCRDEAIEVLVNNAGEGRYGAFAEVPADDISGLVELNAHAPIALSRAALPGMLQRGRGDIVNVSSMFAFTGSIGGPLPKRAVYAGTKRLLVTFSQLLAEEVDGTGVRVQALCPSIVATEFHEKVGADLSDRPQTGPDVVVTASLRGLELGEVVCAPVLSDLTPLERAFAAERELFAASRSDKLAGRYRD
jgi:short-subunit dehydrogenase